MNAWEKHKKKSGGPKGRVVSSSLSGTSDPTSFATTATPIIELADPFNHDDSDAASY